MTELVSYTKQENAGTNPIATITMDDGKANSMSPTMIKAVNKAFDKAEADQAIVIFTGREGKFSAGFDLAVMSSGAEAVTEMLKGGAELAERLMNYPYPVVIACNGHGLAMGALLLLAADYRIGTLGKYKIGLNEVAIGMIMPAFGCEIARYALSHQFFKRCLVNAEIFTPRDALQPGFLDEVVETEELMARTFEKAQELAKLNMAAFKGTKLGARKDARAALRAAIEKDFR
jgi:enoyl-CoA hydratase